MSNDSKSIKPTAEIYFDDKCLMVKHNNEILVEINGTYHWFERDEETVCGQLILQDNKLTLPTYRKPHLAMCPECIRLVLPTLDKQKALEGEVIDPPKTISYSFTFSTHPFPNAIEGEVIEEE